MSTVIDLTDQELAELRVFTKQPDASAAVRSAMTEYLRFARRMQLKALSGQVQMEENWQAVESRIVGQDSDPDNRLSGSES